MNVILIINRNNVFKQFYSEFCLSSVIFVWRDEKSNKKKNQNCSSNCGTWPISPRDVIRHVSRTSNVTFGFALYVCADCCLEIKRAKFWPWDRAPAATSAKFIFLSRSPLRICRQDYSGKVMCHVHCVCLSIYCCLHFIKLLSLKRSRLCALGL